MIPRNKYLIMNVPERLKAELYALERDGVIIHKMEANE
jgi:hypothetical protein